MLGVASIFSLLIIATSATMTLERYGRANFGFADLQVVPDPAADPKQVAKDVASLTNIEGVAFERQWMQRGDLDGQRFEFHIKGIESKNAVASRLYSLSSGHLPKRDGEVALSATFAQVRGYQIGRIFTLPLKSGAKKLKITGLINDGPSINSVIAGVYVDMPFINKFGPKNTAWNPSSIQVVLKKGESQRSIASRIEKMHGVALVITADEALADIRRSMASTRSMFSMFGAVALVVGMTLIYTAFGITAAEREREFGLLKAIGANSRWARRLVYREAIILGLLYSAIGLLLGLCLSFAFMWIMNTGEPGNIDVTALSITSEDAIISFLAGIGATLFSVFLPARKIGKIHPLAAIRPQPKSEQSISKTRWAGLLIIIAGITMLFKFSIANNSTNMAAMAFAAVFIIYLGVAIFTPLIIGPLFNLLDWLSLKRVGAAGKLASKNLSAQSLRSSRMVTSILVGISFVFLVAFFGESAASIGHQILKEQAKYDLAITSEDEGTLPFVSKELLRKVKGLKEAELVTSIRLDKVKVTKLDVQGREMKMDKGFNKRLEQNLFTPGINAVDPKLYPKLSSLFFPKGVDGNRVWRQLHGKYVLANRNWAQTLRLKPGDRVRLVGKGGKSEEFEILALCDTFLVGTRHWEVGSLFISQENAKKYLNLNEDSDMLVKLKKGSDKAVAIAKIKQLIKGTQLEVKTHKQIADMVDKLMAEPMLFPSLTFNIAVLASLLGLINTIAIGVLERRREIGLIKAIGGTRGQVRLTIALEAVLTSLAGTIFGVLIGTGIAVILFKSISAANDIKPTFFYFPVIVTSFPLMATVALFVMVIIVSIIGALIPVRLANKITPVEALRFE